MGLSMAGHVCLASRLGRILHSPSRSYETRWSRHILIQQQSQVRGHVTSRPAAESRGIDPPDVRRLAKMAHLSVTDEEVKEWEPQLARIVDWFAQLQAVDVEGVPPAVRADLSDENVTRKDDSVQYKDREGLLKEVPEMEGEFVKVPKIM